MSEQAEDVVQVSPEITWAEVRGNARRTALQVVALVTATAAKVADAAAILSRSVHGKAMQALETEDVGSRE